MFNSRPFFRSLPTGSGWCMFFSGPAGDVTCKHPSGAKFVVSGLEINLGNDRGMGEIRLESAIRLGAETALEQNEVALKQSEKDRWIFERCAM